MVADPVLPVEPCVGTQPQHVVVSWSRTAERLGKGDRLLWCWIEPESIGALDIHHDVVSCSRVSDKNGRTLYPRPERRGFTAHLDKLLFFRFASRCMVANEYFFTIQSPGFLK
jgi:hypothetical protein